jgi:hypothetical protein
MSLPACQQRVLDGMAQDLRASEPKMAAMFAIFTRLCGTEGRPRREQLSEGRVWPTWLRTSCERLPGRHTEHGRLTWRRALIAGHLAVFALLFALVIGLSPNPTSSCGGAWLPRGALAANGQSGQSGRSCSAGLSVRMSGK